MTGLMKALNELMEKDNPTDLERALLYCYNENEMERNFFSVRKAAAQLAATQAALSRCVMFLTNINTITEETQMQLVKDLRDAGRLDLAESITLGGFSSAVDGTK